jgi:hypothetical protein
MPTGKLATILTIGAGVAAGLLFVVAFLKARPATTTAGNVSAVPPTAATSSSVAAPLYDVLSGVGGLTPVQEHPDTDGTSIAPTNPT